MKFSNIGWSKMNQNTKVFLVITILFFSIYSFASDGHRATSDEDFAQQQALRIVLQEPDPEFVLGESGNWFKYPEFWFPNMPEGGTKCNYGILCYPAGLWHSFAEVPFIFINHHLNFLTTESVVFTVEDFPDAHYVWWRNSVEPSHTFMELFYGPFFSALAVGTFFLISRSFNYKITTSLALAFILGLATIFFAYSQTSYNNTPSVCFMLAGFLFFRWFIDNQKILYLVVSAVLLVFGFMFRQDVIYVIIPLFVFLILNQIFQKTWTLTSIIKKITKIISFALPLLLGYEFNKTIEGMRHATESTVNSIGADIGDVLGDLIRLEPAFEPTGSQLVFGTGIFGLLFSPGAGLFIYVPILLTVFFAFPDFFRKNKIFTVLLLVISSMFIIGFGNTNMWQGYTAWSPKYLYAIIPFLLLPLGASIEKRGKRILPIICGLAGLGLFFNFVYIIQDVSWFVWGQPGGFEGLMSLAQGRWPGCDLYICPEVTWTFQYSPLINSIYLALSNLHPDLFLLKLFGIQYYILTLVSVLSAEFYLLYRILKPKIVPLKDYGENAEKNI